MLRTSGSAPKMLRTSESPLKKLRISESPLKKLRISGSHRVSLDEGSYKENMKQKELWTDEEICRVDDEEMRRVELDWLQYNCACCGADGICTNICDLL